MVLATEGVFGLWIRSIHLNLCVDTNVSKQALNWQVEPIQVRCLHGTLSPTSD
jgi:hypothetical protein